MAQKTMKMTLSNYQVNALQKIPYVTLFLRTALKNVIDKKMCDLIILAAKNCDVDSHNNEVLNILPGEERVYKSIDHAENWQGPPHLPEAFLRFTDANYSKPVLKLKKNAIVILLRNLNIDKGLCNGTRMRIIDMGDRLLTCEIITGDKKGKIIYIPKITLIDDQHFSCELHRHQFPVKLAFAMTINKSQGQTFAQIGIDLRNDVFSHGQLYVAVSRGPSWDNIKILLPKSNKDNKVKNVVWKEVL